MPDDLRRAALHCTAAAASFACMGAFAKASAQQGASEVLIVFVRNLMGVLALLPWVLRNGAASLKTNRLGGHLWRALFGLCGMYSLFYAITHLPLAESLLLNYASPLFIPFIAWIVLAEKPPPLMIPAALLGLAGVALIVKPASLGFGLASWLGAASGVFAACAMVSLRRISDTEPAPRVVFYFSAIGTVVSLVPLFWFATLPTPMQMLLMVATGLAATNGQLQLTRAYSHAPAARVGAMGYSAVIFAGLIGWLVWDETLDRYSLLGAVLVIGTCVIASWQRSPRTAPISPEDAAS
ncbi:MAG: DMT family transporter [Pseudomonadota bacterium]